MSKSNLIPNSERTPEELREMTRKGGIRSGEVRREKKLLSQIYAEFLEKEHDVISKEGERKKMSGQALLNSVMSKVLSRSDSSSVAMMREIREATEGKNVNLDGKIIVNIIDDDAD
jgi:hypothetical protein